jgi:uncharacterized membrane protein
VAFARKLALFFVAASLLFLLSRILTARSPTDAFRAVGVSVAACIALKWPLFNGGSRLEFALDASINFLVGLKSRTVFLSLFFWLLSTHTILGWGVHEWQGFDIGFFVQATHNAFSEKGVMFKNIDGDFSFFAHHFSPFLFILSPLGKLQEAPIWLYAIQDCTLALTLTLLYKRIANLDSSLKTAKALLVLILLTHPFWFGLKYYEFHELSFAPLAMFLLLTGWERKNPWVILGACLALLCIKETTFFSLAWFGVVLTMSSRSLAMRTTGAIVFTLAAGCWFLYFQLILPQIAGRSESMFSKYYGHLGRSMLEIALSPARRPSDFIQAVLNPANALYALLMLGLCVPVLNKVKHWIWLIPVIPDFAVALLSRYEGIRNPGFQYAGLVVVPVMFVAISGYSSWNEWSFRRRQLSTAWIVALALSTIAVNPLKIWKSVFWGPTSAHASRDFISHLRDIPKNESVVVTEDNLLPFVSQRENLIWFGNAGGNVEMPMRAHWAAFKEEKFPNWNQKCAVPQHVWQGFILCRLR